MTTSEARMLLVPIRNEYKAKSERSISQLERDIYAMLTEAIEMGMGALEGPRGCARIENLVMHKKEESIDSKE